MVYSSIPLQIVGLCTLATLLVEGLSYVVVYRTSSYKRLVDEVERSIKMVQKDEATSGSKSKNSKSQKKAEDVLKANVRDMFTIRIKSFVIMIVILVTLYQVVTRTWNGMAIGKLPFEPISLIAKVTHKGVDGKDLTDFGAGFVYMLCSVGLRQNISKLINLGPSRSLQKHLGMDSFVKKHMKIE